MRKVRVRQFRRMPLCAIYRIVNVASGKVYVGQTWKPLRLRWREHVRHDHCRKLHYAIRAHGEHAFRVELITFAATQEAANRLEAHFIARHDSIRNGYNIREAGAAGRLSEETKQRMSAAHKGKIISEVQREKARAANLGKKRGPHTLEHRAKMSAAQRGKKFSEERRAQMSAAHLGRKLSPEHVAAQNAGKERAGHREKLRQANLGKRASEDTRSKMSVAITAAWARRKEATEQAK